MKPASGNPPTFNTVGLKPQKMSWPDPYGHLGRMEYTQADVWHGLVCSGWRPAGVYATCEEDATITDGGYYLSTDWSRPGVTRWGEKRSDAMLRGADVDHNGLVTQKEMDDYMFDQLDTNHDGKITKSEYEQYVQSSRHPSQSSDLQQPCNMQFAGTPTFVQSPVTSSPAPSAQSLPRSSVASIGPAQYRLLQNRA